MLGSWLARVDRDLAILDCLSAWLDALSNSPEIVCSASLFRYFLDPSCMVLLKSLGLGFLFGVFKSIPNAAVPYSGPAIDKVLFLNTLPGLAAISLGA